MLALFALQIAQHRNTVHADDLTAGINVVEYATRALGRGPVDITPDALVRAMVHEAQPSIRPFLVGILDTLTEAARRKPGWRQSVARALMAYAAQLHADGDTRLAAVVYRLVSETITDEPLIWLQALRGLAWAQREANALDDAEATYLSIREAARARHLAALTGGELSLAKTLAAVDLEASLGLAKVLIGRANFREAESMVLAVIRRAEDADQHAIIGKAYIDLACIAGNAQRPDDVVLYSHAALARDLTPGDRMRCAINRAIGFRDLGWFEAAEDAAHVVVATARSVEDRVEGMILLYRLAIDRRDRVAAVALSNQLLDLPRTPSQDADRLEIRARELAVLDNDLPGAIVALRRLLAHAETHRLNKSIIEVEQALDQFARGEMPLLFSHPTMPTPAGAAPALAAIAGELASTIAAQDQPSPLESGSTHLPVLVT